MHRGNMNK